MDITIGHSPARGDKRRAARQPMQQDCRIRERGRSAVGARLLDLTDRGCRIESFILPVDGNQLWVRLQGLENLSGRVVWTCGQIAGVAFDQPLHPAVALRLMARGDEPAYVTEAANVDPAEIIDFSSLLSRREQIAQGLVSDIRSPLMTRKERKGSGMQSMVSRLSRRTLDQRSEGRFAEVVDGDAGTLTIAGEPARVVDISASGLRAEVALDTIEGIGREVDIAFAGFPDIEGRIVWRNGRQAGFDLPEGSFDLKLH